MKNDSNETKNQSDLPAPEVLKTQVESVAESKNKTDSGPDTNKSKKRIRSKRTTYRPSHKATFVGLSVVVAILAVNAVVIAFLSGSQDNVDAQGSKSEVIISPAVLDTLGVSRNPIGSAGTELVVGPNSRFDGTVTIGSSLSVAGDFKLNSKFSAGDASLAKLQAGDTVIETLNVNGDATASNLTLRKDLTVAGTTRLQGAVTISQLLTVNNNVNIVGSLAVGGTLSARTFQAGSLVSDTTLTIGGHIITRGSAPGVSAGGSALGSNGTVSISGNDASGTVAANIGTGAGTGLVAQVFFRNQFSTTPHVVVTPVGRSASFYITRTSSGFNIYVSSPLPAGGIAFDYMVMQ